MSTAIGFLLSLGFAALAVDTFADGHHIAACIFVAALIATLLELMREDRKGN